jgi:hypothetical protein
VKDVLFGDDVEFSATAHRYADRDGNAYPSVTTALRAWSNMAGVPDSYLEAARLRGETVHLITELDDRGELDEDALDEEMLGYLCAWRKFRADWRFTPALIEARFIHQRFGYAGTPDRLGNGYEPGRSQPLNILLDIKSGAEDPTHGPQTAAYQRAMLDAKRRVDRRLTVYLNPGGYKVTSHTSLEDWAVFMSALQWLRWRERHGIN